MIMGARKFSLERENEGNKGKQEVSAEKESRQEHFHPDQREPGDQQEKRNSEFPHFHFTFSSCKKGSWWWWLAFAKGERILFKRDG